MARFALKTGQQHITWSRMLGIWQAADEIELFESAWNFDHFYPIGGDSDGPCLEAWVTLSALAQATSRIRIGTMVNAMQNRHPAVVASMAASLDVVSGGRFQLGLGAGSNELESGAYGIELGTLNERMTRFEEGTEVIHMLLTQEHSDFKGQFYTLTNARNQPGPIQTPRPPIAIGGSGEKRTLRLVARFADIWDTFMGDEEEWTRLRDIMWAHCADVGRDPEEITCASVLRVDPDPDLAAVAAGAARLFDVGVDLAILRLEPNHDQGTVEALARTLSEF